MFLKGQKEIMMKKMCMAEQSRYSVIVACILGKD